MDAYDIQRIIRRILFAITALSIVAGTAVAYTELQERALHLAEHHASSLMAAAEGLAAYTREHVAPLIDQLPGHPFYPDMEPSFAVQRAFHGITSHREAFTYRAPALNPTSPGDLPSAFEVGLIHEFRGNPQLTELTGLTDTPHDRLYYLARPVKVASVTCLRCHGDPKDAPPSMLARYGQSNGFGWKVGEVIGIQLLTIPVTAQFGTTLWVVMVTASFIVLMFVICYAVLAVSLNAAIVRPLQTLTRAADAASMDAAKAIRLPGTGIRELHRLAEAIERLRFSLAKAMTRLSEAELEDDAAEVDPARQEPRA